MRKIRTVKIPSAAVPVASDSLPVVPPKSHPDYFKIIGLRSAAKRKMTSADFSAMAKKSHGEGSRRTGYFGGRKPKGQAE